MGVGVKKIHVSSFPYTYTCRHYSGQRFYLSSWFIFIVSRRRRRGGGASLARRPRATQNGLKFFFSYVLFTRFSFPSLTAVTVHTMMTGPTIDTRNIYTNERCIIVKSGGRKKIRSNLAYTCISSDMYAAPATTAREEYCININRHMHARIV